MSTHAEQAGSSACLVTPEPLLAKTIRVTGVGGKPPAHRSGPDRACA